MIKLKSILSEGYAWEREEGKPLPTLAQTTAAYAAKLAEQSAAQDLSNPMDEPIEEENGPALDGPIGYDDSTDSYIDEEAKPDYIDADGDGDEEESMKKAFADKEQDVKEAFARRMRGNLKGSEHILTETFKH